MHFSSGETLHWHFGPLQSWQPYNFIDKTYISMAFSISFITLERHVYDEFKLCHLHAYFPTHMQILSNDHFSLCVTKLSSFNTFSSCTSLTVGLLQKIIKHYAQWVLNTPGVTEHLWDCRGVNHWDERFSDATYCLCSYYMPSFLWIPPLTKNTSQILYFSSSHLVLAGVILSSS